MRKVYNVGKIDDFKSFLSKSHKSNETFKVVSNGLSRVVHFQNGTKFRYFGTHNTKFVDGVYLTNLVKREIDAYIEEHGIPETKPKVDVQRFNVSKINSILSQTRKVALFGVDINSCYWRTANLLGYISDDLYERGLKTKKKKGLLVAIGCLNKLPIIKTYQKGVCVQSDKDYEYNARYSPFYWNIIYHTYELMMEAYAEFGDDFVMYLTDCLFVQTSKMKVAKEFFMKRGYMVKTHLIDLVSYDGRELKWFDSKDKKVKSMFAMNRDIELENACYLISKGMQSTPPPKLHTVYNNNATNER
jgi:hypothetical protein